MAKKFLRYHTIYAPRLYDSVEEAYDISDDVDRYRVIEVDDTVIPPPAPKEYVIVYDDRIYGTYVYTYEDAKAWIRRASYGDRYKIMRVVD